MRAHPTRWFVQRWLVALIACAGAVMPAAAVAEDRITGGVWTYEVKPGDSWRSIGSRVGVDPAVLAAANGLAPSRPLRTGQRLDIDNEHIVAGATRDRPIVVNVPQRMLFFVDQHGDVTGLPVAVGRPTWRTPLGPFRIVSREQDPSWEVPESIREEARQQGKWLPAVVPPGPSNPLGKVWLGLSLGAVGIHGTNAPSSIYTTSTHGCIRLHPDDAEWLFAHTAVGVTGAVISQPVLLAAIGDDVLLEAHRDVYESAPADVLTVVRRLASDRGVTERVDWAAVDLVLQLREGVARVVTRGQLRTTSGIMRGHAAPSRKDGT